MFKGWRFHEMDNDPHFKDWSMTDIKAAEAILLAVAANHGLSGNGIVACVFFGYADKIALKSFFRCMVSAELIEPQGTESYMPWNMVGTLQITDFGWDWLRKRGHDVDSL